MEKKEEAEKKDKGDNNLENNLSMTKISTESEKSGIENAAFESEKLWLHSELSFLRNDD